MSAQGRLTADKANIVAIFESPSFIPGKTNGISGIDISIYDSTSATADSKALWVINKVLLFLISSPRYRIKRRTTIRHKSNADFSRQAYYRLTCSDNDSCMLTNLVRALRGHN